ncbi:hypothetical protein Poly21_29950 [Allorhodopirellula heiligendammensis]|uniref:Uncharacterized protein n=1 Tax=Allorhodopirellula heiligendammensis TaxID=2714739 RepID=A0A5C6BU71_9BACT|nr:hypothetical protein Poly21_29950 [Allorhodopirellula heiligendammensis]
MTMPAEVGLNRCIDGGIYTASRERTVIDFTTETPTPDRGTR